MDWFTGIAIFLTMWWVILFCVLPIGVRSQEEEPARQHGREAPAEHNGAGGNQRQGRQAAQRPRGLEQSIGGRHIVAIQSHGSPAGKQQLAHVVQQNPGLGHQALSRREVVVHVSRQQRVPRGRHQHRGKRQ